MSVSIGTRESDCLSIHIVPKSEQCSIFHLTIKLLEKNYLKILLEKMKIFTSLLIALCFTCVVMRSEAACFGPRCPSKTFFFIGAPAPGNGCGEFKLLDGTTAYAKRIGYQEGTCASQGYRVPAGSARGNGALPKFLGLIAKRVRVQYFN